MTLERDLDTVSKIHSEIKEINLSIEQHKKYGKHLHICFLVPSENVSGEFNEASVGVLLQLDQDQIQQHCNILLNDMLQYKLNCKRLELKKLGFKLDGDVKKKRKKDPLRLTDESKTNPPNEGTSGVKP